MVRGWRPTYRRKTLARTRWRRGGSGDVETRTPQVLGYMDRLSGMFIEGGFRPDLTHHVMHALGHRIWGFSPEAFDDPDSLQPPVDPAAREAMVQVVQQTYPYIAMIALDTFLRLHEAGWRSAR